jgi:hypothetical protein
VTTRTVDARTLWAILAMEAALALPLISLPTQGDRLAGLAGPVLLLMLLPAGYAAVYEVPSLRDPSWRLLTGIGLALFTRLIVSSVPTADLSGFFVWLGRSVVPSAIGVALWWRGGALAVAELTPADVRTEFSILAVCLVAVLSLIRPFLLPDPALLGSSVGLFAVGGLVGTALSRQAAGSVGPPRSSATLAVASSLLPAAAAVLLVGFLRPALLGTMWSLLARAIELALTPIGLLIAWLASLFPPVATALPSAPVPRPTLPQLDPAALAEAQDRMSWLATLIIVMFLVAIAAAAILAAKLLLDNWVRDPRTRETLQPESAELVAERSGTPHKDAADFLGWLMRWLRARFSGRGREGGAYPRRGETAPIDAWAAYQRLLTWAERRGLGRRPAETTGQLLARLTRHAPDARDAVDLVTRTYEWERYGAVHPASDRLRRVRDALGILDRVDQGPAP